MDLTSLIEIIMKIFETRSWVDKVEMTVDSIGLSLTILLFGFGFKDFIDGWFPTAILILTVASLSLTVLKKAYDMGKAIYQWFKKR